MQSKRRSYLLILTVCVLIVITACSLTADNETNISGAPSSTQVIPTLVPPTAQPTRTSSPAITSTPTLAPTPTVHGVVNPSGTLPAGMPAIADGFVMVIDKSGLIIDDKFIGFEIQVEVIGDESRLFRYNAAAMRLSDDLGNLYENYIEMGFTSKCSESDLYNPKQLMIDPKKPIVIEPETSMMYSSYFWWCIDSYNSTIPGFIGYIPMNAKALILEFEGFGPFSNFAYMFDL